MKKIARKPSSDPIQEKLRQAKDAWNKEVSSFISDIIDLKRLMNGHPSKFHNEKSSIKDALPADPATILGVLASDFQEIASKGSRIVQEQLEYSEKRRKKGPKNVAVPSNLEQQLNMAATHQSENLISEGSNPVSRFLSRLKGPWFGDSSYNRKRTYRLSMLRAAAKLDKELEDFEGIILESSADSIFQASKMLIQVENNLSYLNGVLEAYKTYNTEQKENSSIKEENKIKEAVDALNDFRKYSDQLLQSNVDPLYFKDISSLVADFVVMQDFVKKNEMAIEIIKLYNGILTKLNKEHNTSAKTFEEFFKNNSNLDIIASNVVSRWFGKTKHKINPFDKTSPLRLDISKNSEDMRDLLNDLMNNLEKELNLVDINILMKSLYTKLNNIKTLIKPLEISIKNRLLDRSYLSLLEDKDIINHSLSPKEREHLDRSFRARQFREFSNNFGKK